MSCSGAASAPSGRVVLRYCFTSRSADDPQTHPSTAHWGNGASHRGGVDLHHCPDGPHTPVAASLAIPRALAEPDPVAGTLALARTDIPG